MEEKNYITPSGFKNLQVELKELKYGERPKVTETVAWAAGNGDRSENGDYIYGKKRLREIDRRIRFLMKRIDAAEVVDPAAITAEDIRFGATVTVLNEDDEEKVYTLVGADETDIEAGCISWKSPLALALFKKQEGDVITFRSPKGEQELEVIGVKYLSRD